MAHMQRRYGAKKQTMVAFGTVALMLTTAACGGVQGGAADDAAEYPTASVELTIPFSAGGGSDLLGRLLAGHLEDSLGESIVVTNKDGASGNLGTAEVARSEPDGYSLIQANATQFSVTPVLTDEEVPVTLDDLDIFTGLTKEPVVLFTRYDAPYESIDDVLALADGDPVTVGTSGPGTATRLGTLLFFNKAGIEQEEVPFKGGTGEVVPAVLGGHVEFAGATYTELASQVGPGGVKILAVMDEERLQFIPDVPTAKESGVDVSLTIARFIAAPQGLPENVRDTIQGALTETLESDEWLEVIEENSLVPYTVDGETVREETEAQREGFEKALAEIEGTS